MKPKEIFWIGAKGGLLDQKHYRAMGEAVWLFLYLLMRQTQVNEEGEGVVRYGNPTSRADIAADTGWSDANIKHWTARLIRGGYVRTVRSGNDGLIFFISKAKRKVRNPKPTTRYFPAELRPNGDYKVGPQMHRPTSQVGPQMPNGRAANAPTCANKFDENQQNAAFPTTLISKNLSNYNKESAAKSAASPIPSLKEILKEKTVPKEMNPRELDARRRELLQQDERLRREHPDWYKKRGQVMQPQEAIA